MLIPLHWLPIRQRIEHKLATLAFCYFDGTLPPYLSHSLSLYTPHRSLLSSSDKLLSLSHVLTWKVLVQGVSNIRRLVRGILFWYKPNSQHLSLYLFNPTSKRTSFTLPSPESLKLSPEAWWVGEGLQSMGLTGEPAAAATFSSAVCVCAILWTCVVCHSVDVCVCVCLHEVWAGVCRCLCIII